MPDLPPPIDLETKAVLKRCIGARAALAELNKATELIPNRTVLINSLPLLEAKASSEIENIVTTTDRLFRHAAIGSSHADPATKEALNYRSALYEGFKSLRDRPLCTATAEIVCSRIKGVEMQIRKVPGTRLVNDATGDVIYTPPVGEEVLRSKMANWERFLHGTMDLDPLIRLAVGHYQFEAIHPFTDGNGRTGRILNLLFLVDQGLLESPILYHSRAIIATKADYYRLLQDVTAHQNWEAWILFMLGVMEETSRWTTAKISAIRKLQEHTTVYLREKHPAYFIRDLVDLVFIQPYCRIANVVEAGIAKRQSASKYLKQMVEAGVLEEIELGRDKLFLNQKFRKLLFEERNAFEPYF